MATQQINHITRKPYSNTNHSHLEEKVAAGLFSSNEWLTLRQANGKKLAVKKGQHGTPLIRMVRMLDEKSKKYRFLPVYFTVFNIEQTEPIKE